MVLLFINQYKSYKNKISYHILNKLVKYYFKMFTS